MSLKENQNKIIQNLTISNKHSILKTNKGVLNCINANNNGNYEMSSKLFDLCKLRKSPQYGIKKYSDSYYEGELLNEKRHGKGIMIYNNGRIYEGEWVNDEKSGKGFERYYTGNIYEGNYKFGKPNGKGAYTWNNGEIYEGEWKNGLKHGYGAWKGINGDSYIGEWKLSKADGYGVHIWPTGDRYEGEWKACLKHGQGTDIYSNGDVYTGRFCFGKASGYGQYNWKDGSFYIGEFYNGLKCGFGQWKKSNDINSNTYEGQYFCDKKQGFGIFKWSTNSIYRGQYNNDEKEGIGEMRWNDGSHYIGMWVRGIQHGYGRMWMPNRKYKEGLFENNVYKGPWKGEPPINSSFEIMDLMPPNLKFSKELTSIIPSRECLKTAFMESSAKIGDLQRAKLRPYTNKHRNKSREIPKNVNWCFTVKKVYEKKNNSSLSRTKISPFDSKSNKFRRTDLKWNQRRPLGSATLYKSHGRESRKASITNPYN